MMTRNFLLCLLILLSCKQREETSHKENANSSVIDTTQLFQPKETVDYSNLYGNYVHESTTKGFSGYLNLRQNGLDLYFTLSINQSGCLVTMEGIIAMIEHTKHYYIGFHHSENCQLQFTFMPGERKVDIKEVSGCVTVNRCSTEGTYIKQGPVQ